MKVLLVEDSIPMGNLLAESFVDHKITCITKSSALGALEFLEQNKVDVIISDLHLPHLSGEELAQIVKKKYQLPIILTSGDYAIENNHSFDAFILKPFDFDELLELVQMVASRPRVSRPRI